MRSILGGVGPLGAGRIVGPIGCCASVPGRLRPGRSVHEGKADVPSAGQCQCPLLLGLLEYHPDSGRLLDRTGGDVFLRAQSARVLHLLVDNLGQLVSRDRLIEEVWPDVSVTDDSLTQCIADIRRAIGDSNREILRTIPKRGFILQPAAGVPRLAPAQTAAGDTVQPTARAPMAQSLTLPRVAAHHWTEDLLPTIAVIPLRSRQIRGEDGVAEEVVGEVVAEEIIYALSRSQEVYVVSRLSSTYFRSREASLEEIGRTLSADYVISGSLMGNADRVILGLEFAESETGRILWSDRVESTVPALLNEPDTIQMIVGRIRKAIFLRESQRARSMPFTSLPAYSQLIGAVGLMHRLSPPDFEESRSMLAALIERWPEQPAPLSWMARWHVLRVQQGWSDAPAQDADLALTCSGRALEIDPDNSLALTSEGFVLTNLLKRLDDAEDRYNAALDINPSDAVGRLLRGTLYSFEGKGAAAVRDTERALLLAPLDPHRYFFLALAAGAHLAHGDHVRALELADMSLRLNRTHTSTLRIKTVAQINLGQEEAARETALELLRLQPSLRIGTWLGSSPSAEFEIGRRIADALRAAGVPD
ncbi:winged helix-turn-helix domain-containing tetratricopeptide repeat protein [Thalassobaculum salexigens]|uniref:winged helix-turn-helix domain-containing tetratricopeptide repeat protein n=1 Tax=Thalassobaculum salexigens TaxID=455360 RepID=UPI00248E6807|nr:winged helix-turn-helix domain-containing protein [Thalassobaculum salexigens]